MKSLLIGLLASLVSSQTPDAFPLTKECLLKSELVTASEGGTFVDEADTILNSGATSDWRMVDYQLCTKQDGRNYWLGSLRVTVADPAEKDDR